MTRPWVPGCPVRPVPLPQDLRSSAPPLHPFPLRSDLGKEKERQDHRPGQELRHPRADHGLLESEEPQLLAPEPYI